MKKVDFKYLIYGNDNRPVIAKGYIFELPLEAGGSYPMYVYRRYKGWDVVEPITGLNVTHHAFKTRKGAITDTTHKLSDKRKREYMIYTIDATEKAINHVTDRELISLRESVK
jgi:hypothetical protein